jgi:outer membrane protein TolC
MLASAVPAFAQTPPAAPAQAPAAAPAPVQLPSPRVVDLDAAVQQAVAKNITLASAQLSIARAEGLLQQSRAALMPTVGAAVSLVLNDSSRSIDGNTTQPRGQAIFSATASMPLLAPEAWAQVGQSRDQIELARLSTAETRQAIAVATANAYISVMAARRQVEVSQRALESARAHLDFAQKRLEGGAGSRLNQARAAQAVSRDEAQLENTTFALLVAQEALGVLMGEDGPIDAASEPVFDDPVAVTGDEWLAQRPDIQFETRNIEAADRVVRDTWRAWLPTASLSFTPQAVTPGSLFSNSRSWQLGVGIQQRVFDRRPAAAKALRQVALSQARFARDDVELRARSEVRQARQSVVLLERALLSSRRAAEQAAEVLRISTSAFELGATTNLEVIDAQQTAQDADSSVSLAEYALRRARLNLLVALGQFK